MMVRKQSQRRRHHSCGHGEIHSKWTLVTGGVSVELKNSWRFVV